jgi:hypothetical protein
MTEQANNDPTAAWAYRIILGFIQGDDKQIASIFEEVYHHAEDTGQLTMDIIKRMAATSGLLYVARHNNDIDAAIAELQRTLREIALEQS